MARRARAAVRALVALAGLGVSSAAAADEWEIDDGLHTWNALFHGSQQTHDLGRSGALDEDWYLVANRPFSSYQVLVHGLTGDVDPTAVDVQLLNAAGSAAVQDALVLEPGVLSLQWHLSNAAGRNFVRVSGPNCTDFCENHDSYRIVFYDTTCTVPRVNNSGTQSSVLLVQNAANRSCVASVHYFDGAGTHVATGPILALAPYALEVVATAATFPGQSGSVRVTHTCGYGGLSGKVVAIEAATGFTFDTPFVHRPH